jgi:hypothetical protein
VGTADTATLGRGKHAVAGWNVAVTDCAEFIVTQHVPVPEQAPLQAVNTLPALAVALKPTDVPTG